MSDRELVVFVDDEPAVLSALERSLRAEPYEVLVTGVPSEALAWVASRDVSLVVSDQRMPEIEGTSLLEEVGRRSPATARVILTAYPQSVGLASGIDGMIAKPWDGEMLKQSIRQFLHGRDGAFDDAAELGD